MKIVTSSLDINRIISLPQKEFIQYSTIVEKWLASNYPKYADKKLSLGQHRNQTMLMHILKMLSNLDTSGLSAEQIHDFRVAIIHHDMDKFIEQGKRSEKRVKSLQYWKDNISQDLVVNNPDTVDLLIKHHDTLGYFNRSHGGKDPKDQHQIWRQDKTRRDHHDIVSREQLDMIRRMNIADNEGSALTEEKKRQRAEGINALYQSLQHMF
jgi:hypothetical protein